AAPDAKSEPNTAASGAPTAETKAASSDKGAAAGAQPSLRALCERGCGHLLERKCSQQVADTCKQSCDQYDRVPKPCESYAREALDCSDKAPDFQCANIAPESCTKLFRNVAECLRAPDTFQAKSDEGAKGAPPAGWERYEDKSAG